MWSEVLSSSNAVSSALTSSGPTVNMNKKRLSTGTDIISTSMKNMVGSTASSMKNAVESMSIPTSMKNLPNMNMDIPESMKNVMDSTTSFLERQRQKATLGNLKHSNTIIEEEAAKVEAIEIEIQSSVTDDDDDCSIVVMVVDQDKNSEQHHENAIMSEKIMNNVSITPVDVQTVAGTGDLLQLGKNNNSVPEPQDSQTSIKDTGTLYTGTVIPTGTTKESQAENNRKSYFSLGADSMTAAESTTSSLKSCGEEWSDCNRPLVTQTQDEEQGKDKNVEKQQQKEEGEKNTSNHAAAVAKADSAEMLEEKRTTTSLLVKNDRIERGELNEEILAANSPPEVVEGVESEGENENDFMKKVRKAGVAIGGGAMVGVGLVMIPLPTPFGAVIAAGGMSVLGTEFPVAQEVLEKTRDKVVEVLENNTIPVDQYQDDDADDDDNNDKAEMKEIETQHNDDTNNKEKTTEDNSNICENSEENKLEKEGADIDAITKIDNNNDSAIDVSTITLEQQQQPSGFGGFGLESFVMVGPDNKERVEVAMEASKRTYKTTKRVVKRNLNYLGQAAIPVLRSIGGNNTQPGGDEDAKAIGDAVDVNGGAAVIDESSLTFVPKEKEGRKNYTSSSQTINKGKAYNNFINGNRSRANSADSTSSIISTSSSATGTVCPVPEIWIIQIYKTLKSTKCGIILKRTNPTEGPVFVDGITENSLFVGTNLQVGDIILSVNNVDCRNKSAVDTARIIAESVGVVSIVYTRLQSGEFEKFYAPSKASSSSGWRTFFFSTTPSSSANDNNKIQSMVSTSNTTTVTQQLQKSSNKVKSKRPPIMFWT